MAFTLSQIQACSPCTWVLTVTPGKPPDFPSCTIQAILKFRITVGGIQAFTILMPRWYYRSIKSECLGREARYHYFLKIPRCFQYKAKFGSYSPKASSQSTDVIPHLLKWAQGLSWLVHRKCSSKEESKCGHHTLELLQPELLGSLLMQKPQEVHKQRVTFIKHVLSA